MKNPSLSEQKKKHAELYNKIYSVVEGQLNFAYDQYTAKKMWDDILKDADLSVLADVLSGSLCARAPSLIVAKSILSKRLY